MAAVFSLAKALPLKLANILTVMRKQCNHVTATSILFWHAKESALGQMGRTITFQLLCLAMWGSPQTMPR